MEVVSFRKMAEGTAADYALLDRYEHQYIVDLPGRIMESLASLKDGLSGYQVDRLTHSLQTATLAEADGADAEMVLAALIHDIGDGLAPANHSQMAAAIVRPYVREEVTWVVAMHGVFQLYYYGHLVGQDRNAREQYRGHKWFDSCANFCERWDQAAFDPDFDTLPLSHFEPLVTEIFSRTPFANESR